MTDEQLAKAAAELEAADTEIAALNQKVVQSIASARVHNRARQAFEDERDAIQAKVLPLREAIAKHMIEVKRQQSEAAKKAAEERAKAEAEAKAKEVSELERLAAENAKLKEQLAAKG